MASPLERRMQTLRTRECLAREEIKYTARSLKHAIAAAVKRESQENPWTLPVAGFCAGVLIPFLIPVRGQKRRAPGVGRKPAAPRVRDADAEAGAVAAAALTQAIGATVRIIRARPTQTSARRRSIMDARGNLVIVERAKSTTLAESLQNLLGAQGVKAFLDPYTADETVAGELYREFTGIDVAVRPEDEAKARSIIAEAHRAGQLLNDLDQASSTGPE